jgi:hypothetical protein
MKHALGGNLMRMTFDIELSGTDQDALIAALGLTERSLNASLSRHAKAALHEYIECYLGRRAFTRGSDILEHRLSLLVCHAFENDIPNDALVSRLFQTTLSASRTLIRNALSKYRYQLGAAAAASGKLLLEKVSWAGSGSDTYHAKVAAPNLIEILNQRLLAADPTLKAITRLPDSVGTYAINQYSYDKLCDVFGATKVGRR